MPTIPYKQYSIVFPVYFPDMSIKNMSDTNFLIARSLAPKDVEWVIVETESTYHCYDGDVYIHEKERTHPDISTDRGFRNASGEYVIFLANDVKVCNGWVEKMFKCFETYEDCGIASLGNNEHGDTIKDEITSDSPPYFSVCMMKKEDAWFDLSYPFNFADTDLLFRLYLKGKKWYKNLSGLVYHKNQATCGQFGGSKEGYEKSREHFIKKFDKYKDDPMFKTFAGVI